MDDALASELLRGLSEGRAGMRLQAPTIPIPRRTSPDEAAPVLAEALVLTTLNQRAAQMLGFPTPAQALGANCASWWSFEQAITIYKRLWSAGTLEVEHPHVRLTLIEGEQGVDACALEFLGDADALPARLERAQSALETTRARIVALDTTGVVIEAWGDWGPAAIGHWAEDLLPGESAQGVAQRAASLGAPGAAAVGRMIGEVVRGERRRGELDLDWEGVGQTRRILVHVVRVPWGVLLTHYDLTVLGGSLDADRRLEAVGRLAGGVAHDFNNLLTAISGYSELLISTLPEDSVLRPDLLEIRAAGERAADLTQQLLAFSCRQILRPRPLHLPDLVEELRPALERLVGDRVTLEIERDPRLPAVSVDPDQMHRALLNLAHNARESMPEGGRLRVRCATGGEAAPLGGPFVRLEVQDTGIGMSEATLALACEPFFTTRGQAGMGLATVYGIVKQTGGQVVLQSELDSGTTVSLYLPCASSDVDTTPTPASGAQKRRRVDLGGGETILLVEDERPVRDLLKLVLTRSGYIVLEAEDGEDALVVCARHQGTIDLILTDVVMPRLDGVELVRRLRADQSSAAVLFVSGYTPASLTEHGSPLDPREAFLGKPFTPRELLVAVRDALDSGLDEG